MTCPFCGAGERAAVPPEARLNRSAMALGVASVFLAVETVACQTVYGVPVYSGPPFDASSDAQPDASSTATRPPPTSCELPGELIDLASPSHASGACTAASLVAIADACFGQDTEVACRRAITADPGCASCALGRYDGHSPPRDHLGALVPSELGYGIVTPATTACASLVLNRPDCAIPAQRAVTCVTTACSACDSKGLPSCEADAQSGFCAPAFAAASACLDLIVARRGEWLGRCTGATFRDGFLAVAHELCGAPASDGGVDATGDAPTD